MSGELTVRKEQAENCIKVYLSGEVDIYTSQKLKEELYSIIDSVKTDLKLDLRELNYIDSTGLGIIVGTLKKVREYGANIYILNLKPNIKKLFTITGLDKLFIIEE